MMKEMNMKYLFSDRFLFYDILSFKIFSEVRNFVVILKKLFYFTTMDKKAHPLVKIDLGAPLPFIWGSVFRGYSGILGASRNVFIKRAITQNNEEFIESEVNCLMKLSCPLHILRLLSCEKLSNHCQLAVDFATTNLYSLAMSKNWDEYPLQGIVRDLLQNLVYLKSMNCVHGDLRAKNLLIVRICGKLSKCFYHGFSSPKSIPKSDNFR